jgi:hypothetical protein
VISLVRVEVKSTPLILTWKVSFTLGITVKGSALDPRIVAGLLIDPVVPRACSKVLNPSRVSAVP